MRRVGLVALLCASAAGAQRLQPEARFEFIGPEPFRGVAGLAVHIPAGRYVRVGFGGTVGGVGRAEAIARFTFDPHAQQRTALSVGGGISYDVEQRRAFLALHMDLEGPRTGPVMPFVSAGLAGGPRFAVGVRRAMRGRR